MDKHFLEKELLRTYLQGAMAKADRDTWEHSVRVGKICETIARELKLNRTEVSLITLAGLFHDVGKMFITEVINYPGELLAKQRDIIGYHPQLGTRFINFYMSGLPEQIREGTFLHHERLNGRGYPFNLQGGQIPLVARIVAVADVFDAMSNKRPYRPALPRRETMYELEQPGYDQNIVLALMKNY